MSDNELDEAARIILREQAIKIDREASAQKITVSENFTRIRIPARISIVGPTQSGKSTLIYLLVKHRSLMFTEPFKRVILCIPAGSCHQHQKYLEKMQAVCTDLEIHEGPPDTQKLGLLLDNEPKLLIIGNAYALFLVWSVQNFFFRRYDCERCQSATNFGYILEAFPS